MGKLLSQIRKENLKKLSITFYGDLFNSNEKIISNALLKGFLAEQLDVNVNYINAPVLADEMGIALDETISTEQHNYLNLIEVKMVTSSSSWSLSGTVFGNDELRIVEINEYQVEFKPEGSILIYLNIDKPGMLSSVSSKLAAANFNIASLSLGRKTEGEDAMTIINIDSQINAEVEKSISEIDGIKDIYSVYI
jgi:D-3-phosphoglycerate dehydrogenase